MLYGLWYGGVNYAPPSMMDVEEFADLDAAVTALEDRRANVDRRTPCVDSTSRIDLWVSDPRAGDGDLAEPDHRVTLEVSSGNRCADCGRGVLDSVACPNDRAYCIDCCGCPEHAD